MKIKFAENHLLLKPDEIDREIVKKRQSIKLRITKGTLTVNISTHQHRKPPVW